MCIRDRFNAALFHQKYSNFQLNSFLGTSFVVRSIPVSYTHLDVYKRQLNGRGTFVAATNPQLFADGLAAALAKINERTASFSNAGASDSTQLNSGTLIFTASYISGRWTGLLRAEGAVDGVTKWKTSDAGLIPAYGSRTIITRGVALTGGVGAVSYTHLDVYKRQI